MLERDQKKDSRRCPERKFQEVPRKKIPGGAQKKNSRRCPERKFLKGFKKIILEGGQKNS